MLLFLVAISILLSIPSVQTNLGKRATKYLHKEFNVAINVDKVDLSFIGNVHLKDVLIKNHHIDTLIYVEDLTTSIFSYRNIINNKMEMGQISLDNFILNINTYKGEVDDALTVFVDKFDDGTGSGEPSGFVLTSDNLRLNNGYVEIIDFNKENDNPLYFKKIKGNAKNFKIEGPNVQVVISKFSFIENHNIKVERLSSIFSYSKTQMSLQETILETATSSILTDILFTYNREDFSDFNNKVNIEVVIEKGDISLKDIKKFYDELGGNEILHFSTIITGNLNDFVAHNLKLRSDRNAIINGDFNFKNAFNQENGFSLEANISNLTSDYYHLKGLLPNVLGKTLPSSFEKLGRFTIRGKTFITENKINAQLAMNTDLGTIISDLELTNIDNIDKASYFGHIKIIDAELGEMLNDPLIGLVSLEADINGEGFTLEKMNTTVKGVISKHQYKNYTYNNIAINGVVKNKNFNGEMEVNDANIKLNFNGLADFSSDIFTFDFNAVIDYCDLNKLNLFTRDSISNIKGEIDLKVKGNTFDDLVGTMSIKKSLYTNQKDNYFFEDFNITSSFADSIRTITINSSEIIEGRLKGKFKFNELSKLTQNSIGSIYSNYSPFDVSPDQNIDFRFKIYNKIVEVFYPDVTLSANTIIRGNIGSDDNLFRLAVKSPNLEAYNNIINEIDLQIDNKNPLF